MLDSDPRNPAPPHFPLPPSGGGKGVSSANQSIADFQATREGVFADANLSDRGDPSPLQTPRHIPPARLQGKAAVAATQKPALLQACKVGRPRYRADWDRSIPFVGIPSVMLPGFGGPARAMLQYVRPRRGFRLPRGVQTTRTTSAIPRAGKRFAKAMRRWISAVCRSKSVALIRSPKAFRQRILASMRLRACYPFHRFHNARPKFREACRVSVLALAAGQFSGHCRRFLRTWMMAWASRDDGGRASAGGIVPSALTVPICSAWGIWSRSSGNPANTGLSPARLGASSPARMPDVAVSMAGSTLRPWRCP